MLAILILAVVFCCASSFSGVGMRMTPRSLTASRRLALSMVTTPPGTKPTSDGGSKTAGEPLPEYTLALDNGAKAVVRTYGGNCFSYITKDGIEVMGTRGDAVRDDSKPYAGGNPHCFPQFGPGELAQHGFARGMKFVPGERAKEGSFERMVFKLVPTEETIKVWDHKFEYRCDITLREDCMEWDINVMNLGEEPFDITLGMHTYFDISSLKNVKIVGPFTGKSTLDRNKNEDGTAAGDEMTIAEATDMLIRDCSGPVSIIDSGKGTKTTIDSKGFADTCLWSPYGNDAMNFDKFICVEPVQNTKVAIPPGETKFYQKISCVKI